MLSSLKLKEIVAEARPIIERQLDDAELIAGFRDMVSANGGDWSALKALIKAQIQDERDDAGDGKRVRKILDKAEFASAYADMLGLAKMNENNFYAEEVDPLTGEILEHEPQPEPKQAAQTGEPCSSSAGHEAVESPAPHSNSVSTEPPSPLTEGEGDDAALPTHSNSAVQAVQSAGLIGDPASAPEAVGGASVSGTINPDCEHPDICQFATKSYVCWRCNSARSARLHGRAA